MSEPPESLLGAVQQAIFVEPYPNCKACGEVAGYISPFEVSPGCYKILAEDDDWITGVLTMAVFVMVPPSCGKPLCSILHCTE